MQGVVSPQRLSLLLPSYRRPIVRLDILESIASRSLAFLLRRRAANPVRGGATDPAGRCATNAVRGGATDPAGRCATNAARGGATDPAGRRAADSTDGRSANAVG